MPKPTVRIVQTELQPNKRILDTSDIHGNLAYLREVLDIIEEKNLVYPTIREE